LILGRSSNIYELPPHMIPKSRYKEVSESTKNEIPKDHWRKRFGSESDDSESLEDPEGCKENKDDEILETIINKINKECFEGTMEDKDDLKQLIDYLEQTLYDRFINLNNEAYKEQKCKLLGIRYIKPPPILIEKAEVTRYSIGPGEVYTKVKILGIDELPRTRKNVATIRAEIMEQMNSSDS
nr:hypothetical protein [Tanacetum cinerariifolium]